MPRETARESLLDAAERRARAGGYNGFSFREIAADVGVKSASVHYHFPTKAALAEALAERYTARARDTLGTPRDGAEAVARVTALFRDALTVEDRMCLCGVFGAERDALPPEVARATAGFFRMLWDYLVGAGVAPAPIIATLEGALILARVLENPEAFEA
ncbi:MAG: TetR family transcriptional regulator, partial [Pseudomonadota bacterium]